MGVGGACASAGGGSSTEQGNGGASGKGHDGASRNGNGNGRDSKSDDRHSPLNITTHSMASVYAPPLMMTPDLMVHDLNPEPKPVPSGPASATGSVAYGSVPLIGGGGGTYGAARILGQLPPSCPPVYCQLVADCLSANSARRPAVGTVVAILKQLCMEHVPGMVLREGGSGRDGGEIAAEPIMYI